MEDQEYRELVDRFFAVLRELESETGKDMRLQLRFGIDGENYIRIQEHQFRKAETVILAKGDDAEECYEKATAYIETMLRRIRNDRNSAKK